MCLFHGSHHKVINLCNYSKNDKYDTKQSNTMQTYHKSWCKFAWSSHMIVELLLCGVFEEEKNPDFVLLRGLDQLYKYTA